MNAITRYWKQSACQMPISRCLAVLVLLVGTLAFSSAHAVGPTLNVTGVNSNGSTSTVSAYRWLIEEDVTYNIVPGTTCQSGSEADCASANFHKSYLPIIAEGDESDALPDLNPQRRYHVSVLPDSGFALGGAQFVGNPANVSVFVNAQPIPTAQIRIFVFDDQFPINGDPDTPEEQGLGGFNILLEDAGGRYGISGQQITTDAFGNPLGTTYDNSGNVLSLGNGTVTTNASGIATIKNLVPAKYGIQVVPPTTDGSGNPTTWIQTTTLEGKKVVDAWVKANEPPFFAEFGPPGPHVFIGFVQEFGPTVSGGSANITGTVTSVHNSRPPNFTFHSGAAVPGCWVGLNDLSGAGKGEGVYAAPCDSNSGFSISGVPDGSYQLAIWDQNLDYIFASLAITIENGACNGGSCNLGDVPVFAWFGRIEQYVFNDTNENGFWDSGEQPLFEQGTALRWRDGTVYQSFPTDLGGAAPYDEVFPFFSWLVAEVAFDRFKATGATIYVDAGGPVNASDPDSFGGVLNPQPQPDNENLNFRTETGPVLSQGVQTFLGQTNVIQWGKKPYSIGENGGISGIVYYAVTRAEDDPSFAAAEVWEPGIPRIQVALYEDNLPAGGDGVIDDVDGDGCPVLADVDNYPFGFATSGAPGPEDFDYPPLDSNCDPIGTLGNGVFDSGDAVQITTTDSWDDSLPSQCVNDVPFVLNGNVTLDCYDGLRNFNQVRPAVFDGGYAFDSYVPGGVASGATEVTLPNGVYIVGSGEHPVYKTLREEDRNVDFGDEFEPDPDLLPPVCVGDLHTVASEFSLFPLFEDDGVTPAVPYMAGNDTPLCDRKNILLTDGKNAAVDFYMFTLVPVAAKVTGFMLDDTANEFDASAPTFGEKHAPPYLPISIRDWTGREFGRTYSDRWGSFNAVLPSTFTTNVASSSGMSPNMVTTCMNDPGPIPDGNGGFVTDPHYNAQYSQFCYTFQYMPGVTTFLDTPVVPVSAFAGIIQAPLDCRDVDGTPVIWSVLGSMNGPYVSTNVIPRGNNPYLADGTQSITITAAVEAGRDLGFGATEGTVSIGGKQLTNVAWSANSISATVPIGTQTGQLVISRADNGMSNVAGITVTVGGPVVQVSSGGSIQQAIDLASAGDLVLVPPGDFEELVIMHKPVRLQGSGASSTISAIKSPAEKLETWRQDIVTYFNNGAFSLLPSQLPDAGQATLLATEEGPGVIVLGTQTGGFSLHESRIDGFNITGSDHAGGIVVNGYAEDLVISNNRIHGNNGIFGGGVRVGHANLAVEVGNGLEHQDGFNDNINIHHNVISQNGSTSGDGVGGGVSLYHGSDNYAVADNTICGNFAQSDGAGIGHYGLNDNGLIANNTIIFNQSFRQLGRPGGGGIFIGGAPNLNGGLGDGSGSVQILANLIQGNQAGAGDGGGISASGVNGDLSGSNTANWHRLDIINNMIVNNMAAMAGAGLSLRNTALVDVINNTVVHNDSTATAGDAFNNPNTPPNVSSPQPAGIVSFAHSAALDAEITANGGAALYGGFAQPALFNNIIWRNRSFYFDIDNGGLINASPLYRDLAVEGASGDLDPMSCLLTDVTGYDTSNQDGSSTAPGDLFFSAYVNNGNGQTVVQQELSTTIDVQAAFDEGGNFIQVRFGPLSLSPFVYGDYNLSGTAASNMAIDNGDPGPAPTSDIDGDPRPQGGAVDIGADEAAGSPVPNSDPPVISGDPAFTSPLPGSILTGGSEPFEWSANDTAVDQWWVYAGTGPRSRSYYDSGSLGTATNTTITGLPTDGSTVTVTLWYREQGGTWKTIHETYTAATSEAKVQSTDASRVTGITADAALTRIAQ